MSKKQLTLGLAQISQQVGEAHYLPYSVGLLQAYAQSYISDSIGLDFLPLVYQRLTIPEAIDYFKKADIIGFSIYIWNEQRSLKLAEALKADNPERLIIFGGPQVPDQAETYLRQYSFIDVVSHGAGEKTLLELIQNYPQRDWDSIAGISYLTPVGFEHHAQAAREKDLNHFPSPYLTGVFEPLLKKHNKWIGMLETNRGCPFSCTFCDWGSAIASKVYRFEEERIYGEIEWIAKNKLVNVFTCDANFGIFKRDIEIARQVAKMKQEYGYPLAFQTQTAKNMTTRVIEVQKVLTDGGLSASAAISLQSVDAHTLASIKRENISLDTYKQLQNFAIQNGIFAYTDMILALPGETYQSFAQGINTVIENGQHAKVLFHNATILPNAEMAASSYREQYGLETTFVNLPGHTPSDDNIPELMEIIIATKDMPQEDWRLTHVFAWFTNFLYYTHKMFQVVMMLMVQEWGFTYREIIEAFMNPGSEFPLLQRVKDELYKTACQYQKGYPESQQETLIWTLYDGMYMTPDSTMQIQLTNAGLLQHFYGEAGELFHHLVTTRSPNYQKDLLNEALRLNYSFFLEIFSKQRFPISVQLPPLESSPKHSKYNLSDFFEGTLRGESIPIRVVS